MRFLYRIVILFVIILLSLYLVRFPATLDIAEVFSEIDDPVRDQYSVQEGIARDFLSDKNQLIYDVMYTAIDNGIEEVLLPISGYSEKDIEVVLISLLNDCPQFFWMDYSNCSFAVNENGISIFLSFTYTGDELKQMKDRLNKEIDSMIKLTETQSFSSEYDKAVFVHDTIAIMCEYDGTLRNTNIHNAYGALVTKKAVCDGYAHAYQLVLQRLGIECHYVTGEARGPDGPQGHAWNIVLLGGDYTSVDLTWNDIDSYMFEEFVAPSEDITSHIYFGLSEEELKQTHKVDDNFIYELPVAKDMNWFSYKGLVGRTIEDIVEGASTELIANMNKTKPYVEFRLTDYEAITDFLEVYSPLIVDAANTKLDERGTEDKQFKNEMICFVTNSDKGCILIVVETGNIVSEE